MWAIHPSFYSMSRKRGKVNKDLIKLRKKKKEWNIAYCTKMQDKIHAFNTMNGLTLLENIVKMQANLGGLRRGGKKTVTIVTEGGIFIMVKELEIRDGAQVERINKLASEAPYEIWVSTDVIMLDARSLLGLYALVGKKVRMVAEDDVDPKQFFRLVDKMGR
jgi:hypothetical protein